MIEGRIRPEKVLRIFRFVIVTKFVMMTSSFGIIIRERKSVKVRFFPVNFRRAKANAASVMTRSIAAVVTTVKNTVLAR